LLPTIASSKEKTGLRPDAKPRRICYDPAPVFSSQMTGCYGSADQNVMCFSKTRMTVTDAEVSAGIFL
jgi:hypothetical protein